MKGCKPSFQAKLRKLAFHLSTIHLSTIHIDGIYTVYCKKEVPSLPFLGPLEGHILEATPRNITQTQMN
jgi:hypothetical protein